jgi:hypothetical protein
LGSDPICGAHLHAAAKTPTEPKLRIVHNGEAIPNAA